MEHISLGNISSFLSIVNLFSGIPLLFQLKNPQKLPSLSHGLIALNNLLWIIYAKKLENSLLAFICSLNMTVFASYSILILTMKKKFSLILGFMLIGSLALSLNNILTIRIYGLLATSIQIFGSVSNLEIILNGIKQKDNSYFNLVSLLLNFPSSLSWTLYAIQLSDIFIFFPSFIDFCFAFTQIILKFTLPNKISQEKEKKKKN